MDLEGAKSVLNVILLLSIYSIPIIVVCVVVSKTVRWVKRRNDRKFLSGLPDGFVQVRRNSIAVHPEKGQVLFYPGNHIYGRDQLAAAPTFDMDLVEEIFDMSGKVRLPGDQDRVLLTKRDNYRITTTDSKVWDFPVKKPYEKTYAVLRKLYYGTLTRQELKDAGLE